MPRRLIEGSAEQDGLGRMAKVVTFELASMESLHQEEGPEQGKVYNLPADPTPRPLSANLS